MRTTIRGQSFRLKSFLGFSFLLLLILILTPAEARAGACSTCSADGQRACCAFPIDGDGFSSCPRACDSGLLQILGCSGACGDLHCSLHTCYARSACGGDGERACCVPPLENSGPPCDSGLAEFTPCDLGFADCLCSEIAGVAVSSSGVCRKPECGGEDERACCAVGPDRGVEGISGPCDAGLIESGDCDATLGASECQCSGALTGGIDSDGVCIDPECGGEGERACCLNEQLAMGVANCESGMVEIEGCNPAGDCACKGFLSLGALSSGTCHEPASCGGEGERACCVAERFGSPCDAGLREVPGCTGDCFCGAGLGNVASDLFGKSTSSCVKFDPIDEPEIAFAAPPPGECSMRGYADLHMHLFADIAHGGGVLAGAPCPPPGDATYCPESFTPGPLAPGGCGSHYCDPTLTHDVNDALLACFGTDRDLVSKSGADLTNPEIGLCGFPALCPCDLPECGGKLFHGDHTLFDDAVGSSLGTLDGSKWNIGAPGFTAWPQWTTTTHQQAYHRWLERAWRGGLRLIVQMAVQNTALCKTNKALRGVNCDDSMAFVDQQLQAAYDFENYIDRIAGSGTDADGGWFRIVLTPTQARRVIGEGKMAVVLGIEVDHLFNCKFPSEQCVTQDNLISQCELTTDNAVCGDPSDPDKPSDEWVREQVDYYHDVWGVRHIFPIHNFDNSFGGTATWQSAIEVGNRFIEGHWYATQDECADEGYAFKLGEDGALMQFIAGLFGFGEGVDVPLRDEEASCNFLGLFPLGKVLVNKMMDKGMIIDIDHMSNRSLDDTILLAQERGGYPLAATHTLFFDLNAADIRHERMRTSLQLAAMNAMGSMVGVMLKDDILDRGTRGQRKTIDYPGSGIVDDCRHSSKTFAQMYAYAVDKMGGRVGMGSDFNGVAGHFGPRFGSDACGGDRGERSAQIMAKNRLPYPFALDDFGVFNTQVSGSKEFDYNTIGMAHVGLLPDFVADLRNIGLSRAALDPLFRSAEEYIKMWELARGESVRSGCISCIASDSTAPTITCPADPVVECAGPATVATFDAPVTSEECSTASAPVCAPASGSAFAPGSTPVACATEDESGNPATCALNVVVADTIAPAIVAPADLPQVECTSSLGASPSLGSAAAGDICDAAPLVANDAPDVFPLGGATVTWTATDAAGNVSAAAQHVAVVDTMPPTIVCPFDVIAECTGAGAAAVDAGSATGADVCGDVALTNDAAGTYPLGETTVTHAATDDRGLEATCAQSIAVVDTTPPTIECPAPALVECAGARSAPFSPAPAVAADLCATGGGPALAISTPPAGVFPLGATRLDYAVTDGAGLVATCDTSVTVEDTGLPSITGVSAAPGLLWPPNHSMVAVAVTAAANDTCDPGAPVCAIVEVTSNEPVDGLGDGDSSPDWEITGPLAVRLRAERSGEHDDGAAPSESTASGRIYSIVVECGDASGNRSTATTRVTVPSDRRK